MLAKPKLINGINKLATVYIMMNIMLWEVT